MATNHRTGDVAAVRLMKQLERLDFGQDRDLVVKKRRWIAGVDNGGKFYLMRSGDGSGYKEFPNAAGLAQEIVEMFGVMNSKPAYELADAWAEAWPMDIGARGLVLAALRQKRPLPWEKAHGEVGELAQRAWIEVLRKPDVRKDEHALAFLSADDAEQAKYVKAHAGAHWGGPTINRDALVFDAKPAGFKIPPAMLEGAETRLEIREEQEARRLERPRQKVVADPKVVHRLKALRRLVKEAEKHQADMADMAKASGAVHKEEIARAKRKEAEDKRKQKADDREHEKRRKAEARKQEREHAARNRQHQREQAAKRKAEDKAKAAQEREAARTAAATAGGRSREPAVCAAEVDERQARKELEAADRKALQASTAHARAVDRLERVNCPTGKCDHNGKKKDSRAACTARAAVNTAAHALQRANTAREKARELHARALLEVRRVGAPTPPAPKPAGERPRMRPPTEAPKGRACGTVCHIHVEQGLCGGQATVLLPSAQGAPREIPTRYCLVESGTLITSHDPVSFDVDARYPAATQERRYDRDRGEQMKVIQIAQNPRPELIFSTSADATSGTPVVTQDGDALLVLGGNGRSMGMRRHYKQGGAVFREYIERHAGEFGFTAAQVKRFRQPVVVRVIEAPRPEWVRLVRDLNQPLTQSMDIIAEGVSLARQMPPEVLDILAENVGDGELGAFFDSRASLPIIHALERGGVITASNRNRLLGPNGLLNDEGKQLVTRQISAAILPDADRLEFLGPQLRGTLARAAPHIIAAAAAGGDWDLRAPLGRAVQDFLGARSSDLSLKRFFQQADLFNPPASHQHPIALRLLVLLDRLGQKPVVFAKVFKYFTTESQLGRTQISFLQAKSPTAALDEAAEAVAKVDLAGAVKELM